MDGPTMMVIGGVGVVLLGVVYFAVRFWLVSTRPAAIDEVKTPNLDRLNQKALERMGNEMAEADEEESEEEAPEGLRRVVPEEK